MRRYFITVGAKTTVNGTVRTGWEYGDINGHLLAREGDAVECPECDSIRKIVLAGPRLGHDLGGHEAALDGDLCNCKCDPPPKLIANQTLRCQWIEVAAAPRARPAAQPAAAQPTASPPLVPGACSAHRRRCCLSCSARATDTWACRSPGKPRQ
ncbi:PAAR domain-containing protein [Pseudomonas violetae]|uniref:PAAR domain-containing protein n=1 Tax=Pseudomonas violetae TaxID=2915813 RepID=A0ABT0F1U6_9PSED|nr:PAAR domain-containing protein [Pseudomonas violetae]MCK1791991.1 PAAR domain-containing protein [Pseudomonas violetae]